jgi:hypothetical protein
MSSILTFRWPQAVATCRWLFLSLWRLSASRAAGGSARRFLCSRLLARRASALTDSVEPPVTMGAVCLAPGNALTDFVVARPPLSPKVQGDPVLEPGRV